MPVVLQYTRPSFCYACGRAYPWMEEHLNTQRELLYHIEKLTQDERNELWPLLQYVTSNPNSDLSPAKRKLIDIKLGKAGGAAKDALLTLIAKYAAEMSKP